MIILCDSWYAKKNLVCIVDEYPNLDLICNARYDSVIYSPAPHRTGKRGRPAKHGERLSPDRDFSLSDDKIGDYYIGVRRVLTNIFGNREVLAYVTSAEKESTSRRLFFSTIFPEQMQILASSFANAILTARNVFSTTFVISAVRISVTTILP